MFPKTFNAKLAVDKSDRVIVIEQNTNHLTQEAANWFFRFLDAPECIGGIDPRWDKDGVSNYEITLCLDTVIDDEGDIEDPENWTDARIVATTATLADAIVASHQALNDYFSLLSQQYPPNDKHPCYRSW